VQVPFDKEIGAMIRRAINTVYAMWLGEMLRFWRSKSRIIGALSTPLTFMVFLAPGLSSGFQFRGGGDVDISFFAPGFIGMSVLFASLFGGGSVLWERESGILKEFLIAPVSRFFIALGKAVGGVTIATIQGIMVLIFALLIGVDYVSGIGVLAGIGVMILSGIGFIGLGIALASRIESPEGFQMIMGFLTMPLVLLSGAFFPISDLPGWLKGLVYVNPLTYGVEALRWCLLGYSTIPIAVSVGIITLFAGAMLGVGGKFFGDIKL
jgi:ABC-2 type transport system permease protein